jgi:hypothetical protein
MVQLILEVIFEARRKCVSISKGLALAASASVSTPPVANMQWSLQSGGSNFLRYPVICAHGLIMRQSFANLTNLVVNWA